MTKQPPALNELTAESLAAMPPPALVAVLRNLAEVAPDRPALTCGDETVTRGELEARANRLARFYRDLGVGEGDTVTIALPNGVGHFAATLATWKLGAVPNPVSPRLPRPEREAIIELAKPALVVGVEPDDHPRFACIRAGVEPDESVDASAIEPERLSPSLAAITSGGSTGRPKLIVLAQPAAIHTILPLTMGMREEGVVLTPSPQYHNMGFQFPWWALSAGCHAILMPKFDAVGALEAIGRHQVDWVALVPTMMSRMLRVIESAPGRFDLSSIRILLHGAAACPPWLKQAWIEILGPERVNEVYAATEGYFGTFISGAEWLQHRGSVGKAMGDVKILGPDGDELACGEVGEIYAALPPGIESARYVGAEVRTKGERRSVGDLGWLDEDGYLYISDRRVDMIISGGANVFPAEVEAAIEECPKVLTSVVVGLPDPDLGQRVHAVVYAQDGLSADELLDFLSGRLVRYKMPRSIRTVAEELRDDAGKVRRSAVRDREIALLQEAADEKAGS